MNACFEIGGMFAVIPSIMAILKDKQVAGVSIMTPLFFSSWGLWNIVYYSSLGQYHSTYAAVLLTITNTIYLFLIWKYKYSDAWRCRRCSDGSK